MPKLSVHPEGVTFSYRRNLAANDLTFTLEHNSNPSDRSSWQTLSGSETIVSDDGSTRVIAVSLPFTAGENRDFYRLRVSR